MATLHGAAASLHHTQSQRLPHQSHGVHQRSKSVVVPPAIPDLSPRHLAETSASGSDDVLIRDVPRLLLPTIEGSPPLSSQATPTSDSNRLLRPVSAAGLSRSLAASPVEPERSVGGTSLDNQNSLTSKNAGEPSVDLELDVKVFINSGKCVLHTRDARDVRNEEMLKRMKKERSFSSTVMVDASSHQPSPASGRKRNEIRHNASSSRLRVMTANTAQLAVDLTIFHIPGLDVKRFTTSPKRITKTLPLNNQVAPLRRQVTAGKFNDMQTYTHHFPEVETQCAKQKDLLAHRSRFQAFYWPFTNE